jgi:hypothetical protein
MEASSGKQKYACVVAGYNVSDTGNGTPELSCEFKFGLVLPQVFAKAQFQSSKKSSLYRYFVNDVNLDLIKVYHF